MRTYLEIGTCDFDTLNERFKDRFDWHGTSVEAVSYYCNKLERRDKNKYINAVVLPEEPEYTTSTFYHVPEYIIKENNLPIWLKGCGSTNRNHKSLKIYSDDIVEQTEVPAVSLESILKDMPAGIDLIKIDAEGLDYDLVMKLLQLGHKFTHLIFETVHMTKEQKDSVFLKLFQCGYEYRGRGGDSIQFSKPSVLFIADTNWSTGSIVRDLQATSGYAIDMVDWSDRPRDIKAMRLEYDAIIGMTLTVAAAWSDVILDASICCSEKDQEWAISRYGTNVKYPLIGGVSFKVCSKLAEDNPESAILYTPATARLHRFEPKNVRNELTTLGWCGVKNSTTSNFFGDNMKRYEMFEEICKRTGLTPIVSNKDYNYETMREFYNLVDLFICTSISEGGPLPVYEAIACGVPVISTSVGLVSEFKEMKLFSDVDSACALIESLRGKQARQNLACNQYNCLELNWNMEDLYKNWDRFIKLAMKRSAKFIG